LLRIGNSFLKAHFTIEIAALLAHIALLFFDITRPLGCSGLYGETLQRHNRVTPVNPLSAAQAFGSLIFAE
jgi:hypothetical protein